MILERFKVPVKDQVFVSEAALRRTVTQIFEKLGLPARSGIELAGLVVADVGCRPRASWAGRPRARWTRTSAISAKP